VIAGAMFDGDRPGFVLLDGQLDVLALNFASGEELQDHTCALAAN
jgi:CDP-diacylglycerol pyrophosphatase